MSKTKASFCVMIATLVTVMTLFFLPDSRVKAVLTTQVKTGTFTESEMLDGEIGYEQTQVLAAPVSGIVAEVLVRPGEKVRQGQLLLRFDTLTETEAMTKYNLAFNQVENKSLMLQGYAQTEHIMEYLKQQAATERYTLQATIAAKQVRALQDGVVDRLYVSAGDMVVQGQLMGTIRDDEMVVKATWLNGSGSLPCMDVVAMLCDQTGKAIGTAILDQMSAPMTNGISAGMQQLTLNELDIDVSLLGEGRHLPIRVVTQKIENAALVPVACVDRDGCIWLERDGYVSSLSVSAARRNQDYLLVSADLLSENVILYPDEAELSEGEKICVVERR